MERGVKIIRKLAITITFLLIFLAIGTVNATNTNITEPNTFINGTVTHCNSTEPFQGATIDVKTPSGSNITSNTTDSNGKYNISFHSTENTLIISAIAPGHIIPTQTIKLNETRTAQVNFQLGTLTLTKGSWDTIGLDHNNVNQGPNQYLVQIRVTNNALTTANNVTANFTFTTTNPYINLAPNENATKNLGNIPPGVTIDVFYLIEITRTSAAYDTSRNYTVTIAGTNTGTPDTITGRLYVQKLVSQNRNNVLSITVSNATPLLGDTITVTVISETSSATYNIVNLPLTNYNPTILQPLNVTTTYGTSTSNNVRIDNPGTTNFNSVWYFKVIGTGTTKLFALITDQSGTSYHYNGDYGENITINVPPEADLGITKTVNNTAPRYGDIIKFTMNVVNVGPDAAENVVVTDLLPAGLIYLSSTPAGVYNSSTRLITWNLGTLAKGASTTLTIEARVNMTDVVFVNTAAVVGSVYDPYTANNTANATVGVAPEADLGITKTVNNTAPRYGDIIKFTMNVVNVGPDAAENVVVSDLLPSGLQFVSASSSSYDPVSGIWTVGNLAKGAVVSLEIIAKVIASDVTITNVATVTSDIYDPNPSNNKASVTIKVAKKPTPKPPKPPKPGEIPMQPTGTPLYLMVFAVLAIISGFAVSRKI